jgi:hypothetical protein
MNTEMVEIQMIISFRIQNKSANVVGIQTRVDNRNDIRCSFNLCFAKNGKIK